MKATDIIRRDHRAAEELFETYKQADNEQRAVLAEDIFMALDAHEKMEDDYFYPQLRNKLPDTTMFDELEQEQDELKSKVMEVRDMEEGREEKLLEVMEVVLAHAKKEEAEILPAAEEVLSEEVLEEMGSKMEPESAVANS